MIVVGCGRWVLCGSGSGPSSVGGCVPGSCSPCSLVWSPAWSWPRWPGRAEPTTPIRGSLSRSAGYDVIVVNGRGEFFPFAEFDLDEIAALSPVAESSRLGVPQFFGEAPNGEAITGDNLTPLVPLDGGFGDTFNRLHMVEGHAPRQPDEIAPSLVAAEVFGLDVGDVLQARFLPAEVAESWFAGDFTVDFEIEDLPATPLRVSGIAAAPGEFPPIEISAGNDPFVHFAASFARSPSYYAPIEALAVRLRGGRASVPSFVAELEQRAEGRPLFTIEQAAASAATQRSIGVQADALRVLAVVAAIAGFLVVGQLLVRQSRLDGADDPALRAMGMSPRQLVGVAVLRVATIAVVGAAVAIGVAVGLSPLFPIGLARDAETDLGVTVDMLVLGVGAICVAVAVALVSVLAAGRVVRQGAPSARAPGGVRRPLVADQLARAGVPATTVHGVRLALAPGRSAVRRPGPTNGARGFARRGDDRGCRRLLRQLAPSARLAPALRLELGRHDGRPVRRECRP